MANASKTPGVVSAGMGLSVVAPIDDGTDAQAIGERLLCAASSLLERCADVQTCDLTWFAPALLRHRRLFLRNDLHAFLGHIGAHRAAVVLAASYCARGCAAGFGLWRDDGIIWICWSPQGREFEAWLRHTIPEFPLRIPQH
jgi:putative hemolysin